ncbi:DMT family transporter [Solirubrobacter soli]|uniref:DMT family transporter n=1 Tax=Solirubrobacter soli TaxID=363832 RepID=UPI0004186D0A|nr:DMT family transporter [Solirubrobacter soli]
MIGAALIASLLWGTADFLGGQASRRHPAAMVAFIGQAVGFVALALILVFHGVDAKAIAPGIVTGLLGAVAVLAFYKALAVGTMSIIAPIVATSAVVPVLYGVFDGERPGALQWLGIVAALVGVILASSEPGGGKAIDQKLALKLAVVAAIGIGFSLVSLDRAAEHDALTGVAAARAVAAPILFGVVLYQRAKAPVSAWPSFALVGLLDTAANSAFAIATTSGLLSLVAVLGGLFPVVTVALAYVLLHERLIGIQRAGVILALAGIPLISS